MFGSRSTPRNALREIDSRAAHSIGEGIGQDRPITAAALSSMTGVSKHRIGLLYDIRLDPPRIEGTQLAAIAADSFRALRDFRKTFNRIPLSHDGQMATEVLARALLTLEKHLLAIFPDRSERSKISVPFRHAATTLLTANRFISIEDAREIATYVLGASIHVTLRELRPREDSPSTPLPLAHAPKDALDNLKIFLRFHRRLSRIATREMENIPREPVVRDVRSPFQNSARPSVGRSAPVHLVAAARRSLLGIKLAAAHGLKETIEAFNQESTISNLRAVEGALSSWRAGEGFSEQAGSSRRNIRQDDRSPEALGRNLFSVPGASHQSVLREVAAISVDWAILRCQSLREQEQMKTLNEVGQLLAGLLRSLHALTAREMLETLSVMSFPKDIDEGPGGNKWRVKKVFPGARWLETGALGRILGVSEASPFDQYSGMASLPRRKIQGIVSKLTLADSIAPQQSSSSLSTQELSGLRTLTRWMNAAATRFESRIPEVPSHEAIWISEYDGGDGVTLPKGIERNFEEMQREHIVGANSRESGFVVPETAAWLRAAIDRHDGFLLTINEGDPQKPLDRSEPEALLVITCNQADPSPILPKLRTCAREFLDKLPATRSGSTPVVLGELAVMTTEGSRLVRDYGEVPLEMLIRQAEFNIISRFAECERVDCLAICKEGNPALKAYKRYGYMETRATYTDEHGTVFNIIYKPLFPADVILGYRDIN